MENLTMVMAGIKDGLVQKSASRKDETAIMKAMLNDPSYEVGIYTKDGQVGTYSPYEDSREMLSRVISTTTKISQQEADELANNYEMSRADANTMVNISKEFVNTYLQTGRKLPLGGRKTINASLILKHVEEKDKVVPSSNSEDEKKTTRVPEHDAVKTICPCPRWLK
ncbi:hypothetical protein [Bacteroides acidifaciens]|uniref:hypothetical protein n=1 Tax=Bacteroides acidifaciens TaxID=85831 RepID=UPI00263BDE3E|nr:hypothetical protein [Bacteroides acidifaciens]